VTNIDAPRVAWVMHYPNLADSRPGQIQRARNYSGKSLLRKAFWAITGCFFSVTNARSAEIF